jgi:hypothetical protein
MIFQSLMGPGNSRCDIPSGPPKDVFALHAPSFVPLTMKIKLLNIMLIVLTTSHITNATIDLLMVNNSLQINKFEPCDNL